MSPMTSATSPSTGLPVSEAGGQSVRGASGVPSKPRMRKVPQRVGKSASAIFFTLSNAMVPFYRGDGRRTVTGDRGNERQKAQGTGKEGVGNKEAGRCTLMG